MKHKTLLLPLLCAMFCTAGCGEVKRFLKGAETAKTSEKGQGGGTGNDASADTQRAAPAEKRRQPPSDTRKNAAGTAEQSGPLLRYGWRKGEKYAYSFQIEVDRGDEIEILAGTPIYTVTQVEDGEATLAFSGRLSERRRSKSGFPRPPDFGRISIFSPFTGLWGSGTGRSHVLTVNDRGEVKQVRGDSQLPYLLGNLSMIVIEPLPEKPREQWEVADTVSISSASSSRFPRSRFGPFGATSSSTQSTDAQETAKYVVERATPDRVVIAKQYELTSSATVNGQPKYAMSGDGRFVLDRRRGVPYKLDFSVLVETARSNTTTRVPIRISCEILSDEKLQLLEREAAAREPRPIRDDELQQLLADLQSGDLEKVRLAALRLEHALPEDRDRAPVSRALESLLRSPDAKIRQYAAGAMKTWATPESVPVLLELFGDDSAAVRWNVFAAAGNLKDQRVVGPLAKRLTVGIDRGAAAGALKSAGPAAEKAVLPHIDNAQWPVRQAVVGILNEVGTEESIPALETVARSDSNAAVRKAAEAAIERINGRR